MFMNKTAHMLRVVLFVITKNQKKKGSPLIGEWTANCDTWNILQ